MKPTGRIDLNLSKHGALTQAYHRFLYNELPLDQWEDVGELAEPIPPKHEYPVDWNLVKRWAAVCPSLAGVMGNAQNFNEVALKLGWHYAWSRFAQHAYLLDAIEELYGNDNPSPSMVIEPGCFTGGLMHFLAEKWPKTHCIGFDVSPVSLDVCSIYSDRLKQKNKPYWLEADFAQIKPSDLPDSLGDFTANGLVIISNTIESIAAVFDRYSYLHKWNAKARLISYWVNLGCTVLLAERAENPTDVLQTIVNEGEWNNTGTGSEARIVSIFKAFSTTSMCEENPLGKWYETDCYVMAFTPPKQKKRLPRRKK